MTDLALYDTAPPAEAPGLAARLKARVLSIATSALLPALRRIAPDQVGGETLEEAWPVVERIRARGFGYTVGFWDSPGRTVAEVEALYLDAIARVAANGGGYVSIKPPALRFDAAAARHLAESAVRARVRLHCDSHGIEVADATFAFAEELLQVMPPSLVSVSVPGRWRRSPDDAARFSAKGVGVRIVKGQWPDPADPNRNLRDGFMDVACAMATTPGRAVVATHDQLLLEAAAACLRGAFEAEMISGLETPALIATAQAAGASVGLYVPYGEGFAPSALRILRQNPRLALTLAGALLRR